MMLYKNGAHQDRAGDWSVYFYQDDSEGNEAEINVTEEELLEYLNDIKNAKAGKIAIRK